MEPKKRRSTGPRTAACPAETANGPSGTRTQDLGIKRLLAAMRIGAAASARACSERVRARPQSVARCPVMSRSAPFVCKAFARRCRAAARDPDRSVATSDGDGLRERPICPAIRSVASLALRDVVAGPADLRAHRAQLADQASQRWGVNAMTGPSGGALRYCGYLSARKARAASRSGPSSTTVAGPSTRTHHRSSQSSS